MDTEAKPLKISIDKSKIPPPPPPLPSNPAQTKGLTTETQEIYPLANQNPTLKEAASKKQTRFKIEGDELPKIDSKRVIFDKYASPKNATFCK